MATFAILPVTPSLLMRCPRSSDNFNIRGLPIFQFWKKQLRDLRKTWFIGDEKRKYVEIFTKMYSKSIFFLKKLYNRRFQKRRPTWLLSSSLRSSRQTKANSRVATFDKICKMWMKITFLKPISSSNDGFDAKFVILFIKNWYSLGRRFMSCSFALARRSGGGTFSWFLLPFFFWSWRNRSNF